MMRFFFLTLAVLAMLSGALSFQVTPRGSLAAPRSSLRVQSSRTAMAPPRRGRQWVGLSMQLGQKDRGSMPSYEEELQEKEFFKTDLDKATTGEKVRNPIVLITLGWLVAMFGVATFLILNGGV